MAVLEKLGLPWLGGLIDDAAPWDPISSCKSYRWTMTIDTFYLLT